MSFKRLLIAILVASGFGSLQAMNMVDPTFKELLERALIDRAAYEDFRNHFNSDMCNVDELFIEPGKTVGQRISEALVTHPNTAILVARVVHCRRTDKRSVIRTLYKAYENGYAVLDAIAYWAPYAQPDVDRYHYQDPAKKCDKSIADRIAERLDVDETREETLAVARLLQGFRTNKGSVFYTLFRAYESGQDVLDDLKSWIKMFPLDVDQFYYNSKSKQTIGERITELLRAKETRKEALEIAIIVDPKRSDRNSVMQTLYQAYENDSTALEDLEDWLNQFEEADDIDTIDYDPAKPGKTIGDRVGERLNMNAQSKDTSVKEIASSVFSSLGNPFGAFFSRKKGAGAVGAPARKDSQRFRELSANEHRKEALAFAKLVQRVRSNKHSVLLTLFKAYETDSTVFEDLKEWQGFVKADVSKIYYDSDKKVTLAQRIEALKRDDVSNLFKLSPATSSDITIDKEPIKKDRKKNNDGTWSLGKKVGAVGALVAGAGLVYYFMSSKGPKNTLSQKPQALPAAA